MLSYKNIVSFLLISSLFILSACAGKPLPSTEMISPLAKEKVAPKKSSLYRSIIFNSVLGGETPEDLIGIAIVENNALKGAIKESLSIHNYLADNLKDATYKLDVFLIEIDRGNPSFILTYNAFIRYKLTKIKNNEIVFDKIIRSNLVEKKPPSAAFDFQLKYGTNQLAELIRLNISLFLSQINEIE